jgi:hypothetical protein
VHPQRWSLSDHVCHFDQIGFCIVTHVVSRIDLQEPGTPIVVLQSNDVPLKLDGIEGVNADLGHEWQESEETADAHHASPFGERDLAA